MVCPLLNPSKMSSPPERTRMNTEFVCRVLIRQNTNRHCLGWAFTGRIHTLSLNGLAGRGFPNNSEPTHFGRRG